MKCLAKTRESQQKEHNNKIEMIGKKRTGEKRSLCYYCNRLTGEQAVWFTSLWGSWVCSKARKVHFEPEERKEKVEEERKVPLG